jgi:RNA polymerase sigma-70 factor (ECF subfamily)
MAEQKLGNFLGQVRRVLEPRAADTVADRQLLESFVAGRQEAAFTALVRRHGAMVFGVCRRVLTDWHDAEDAFQATFLILARQAGSIRRRESVGSWLYGVAYRVSQKAKAGAARRRCRERRRPIEPATGAGAVGLEELRLVLDEELARLPEKYRAPLVLCYLEGKTRDEAAGQLGWSVGALKGRLERGRERLRRRLERRGLAFSVALLVTALSQAAARANLPAALLAHTVNAAMPVAAGTTAAAGGVSASVAALMEGVLHTMMITRLTVTTVVALSLGVLTAGTGLVAYQALADDPAKEKGTLLLPPLSPAAEKGTSQDEKLLQGTWVAVSGEQEGNPLPAERAREFKVLIRGNRMAINVTTEDRWLAFRLDPTKNPKEMQFTADKGGPKELTFTAIYALEDGRLKLCSPNREEAEKPTGFHTRPGSGLVLLVLEREKKPAPPKKEESGEKSASWLVRNTSVNNLKQIALAVHNYADSNGHLPAAAIYSEDGTPLLSWRVAILPYIEQDALYKAFKLDEPWDSTHNKKLLAQMPKLYAPLAGEVKDKHSTFYRAFTGKGTVFPGPKGIRFADIVDGTSSTLMVVEAGEAVPWTKPAELRYAPDRPPPALGGMFVGGFNAAFADGSVRFIKDTIDVKTLRALITRNGGEKIDFDKLGK